MTSPLCFWLCMGFLICLGPADAPAGRCPVSMGGYPRLDAQDRAVELWKGSQKISWFDDGVLHNEPQYMNKLQFDPDTGLYSMSFPKVEDSGHYTYKTTSNSYKTEYIVHIFGPGMENQSIPLVPFNESTMLANLFASTEGGPFIRVASYHKGPTRHDHSVTLKVNNRSLELENHNAADGRVYKLEIHKQQGSELLRNPNITLIIAPTCEGHAIPADNRTLNETTERNTTESDNEDQTKTWIWVAVIAGVIAGGLLIGVIAHRFRVYIVRCFSDAMAEVKDRISDRCNRQEPVDDTAEESDLDRNAAVQQNALNSKLEKVTVHPGIAPEVAPLLDKTQSLGTGQASVE